MSTRIAEKLLYVLFPGSQPMRDWIVGDSGSGEQIVFWSAALGAEPTSAQLDAITDAQVLAAIVTADRAAVAALVTAAQREAKMTRAVALLMIDEFNLHSARLNAVLDAIDAAASLTALKTEVATISNIPTRTKQQMLDAMVAKINAGDTD